MIFEKIENNSLGFYLTNFFPRKLLTAFIGKLSQSENPFIVKMLLFLFKLLSGDLNLSESRESVFRSFHAYFIRELRMETRPIDTRKNAIISPVDCILGTYGSIQNGELYQIKNELYNMVDLLGGNSEMAYEFRNGSYFTLRIKPNFYHRFHMLGDGVIQSIRFIPGELWNINTATLLNIPSLFTKNERAVIYGQGDEYSFALIPVGTVLVGSIRINFLSHSFSQDVSFPYSIHLEYPARKGDELGMFHYGSTVVVLVSKKLEISDHLHTSRFIKFGECLGEVKDFKKYRLDKA